MKRPSGRHPLEIKGVSKSYDDLTVIKDFSASLARGEKIALMGRNGAGKTTMLRCLLAKASGVEEEKDFVLDSGTVTWGHEVSVGYFSQDHQQSIDKRMTSLEWLMHGNPVAWTLDWFTSSSKDMPGRRWWRRSSPSTPARHRPTPNTRRPGPRTRIHAGRRPQRGDDLADLETLFEDQGRALHAHPDSSIDDLNTSSTTATG